MKLARMPTAQGGEWWIIIHDLSVSNTSWLKLRPIHVFTHISQSIRSSKGKVKKDDIFDKSIALENKLFSVRYHLGELRKAIAECNDLIYRGKYIRDYEDQQKVVSVLEAYLNAIYSTLEITARINALIYPGLPQSFREQSNKVQYFSFMKWKWLGVFYDLRVELEHFGTSLPLIGNASLSFENKRPGKKFGLKEGRHEIALATILAFSVKLYEMLDQWACKEIAKADPDFELFYVSQPSLNGPLEAKNIKVRELIKLLPRGVVDINAGSREVKIVTG